MDIENKYINCSACNWALEKGWEKDCRVCDNTRQVTPLQILCNMCGETMCPIGTMNEKYPHGLVSAKVIGGYNSTHLLDMNCYQFSLCEKCLRQLFIQFKIKPDVFCASHIPQEGMTVLYPSFIPDTNWEEDQYQYEYDMWRENGSYHQAYLNGKCNLVKDCNNDAVYTVKYSDEFTEDCCCEEHSKKRSNVLNAKLVQFISNILKPFL